MAAKGTETTATTTETTTTTSTTTLPPPANNRRDGGRAGGEISGQLLLVMLLLLPRAFRSRRRVSKPIVSLARDPLAVDRLTCALVSLAASAAAANLRVLCFYFADSIYCWWASAKHHKHIHTHICCCCCCFRFCCQRNKRASDMATD